METTYKIVRFYAPWSDKEDYVVQTGLQLKTAKTWCQDEGTRGPDWFDGFTKESKNGN